MTGLLWARRGLTAKPTWTEADQLRDTLVELLLERGQPDQAMTVRRDEYTRHPTQATWHALHTTATTISDSDEPGLLGWALEILRQRVERQPPYLGELVAVLLDVGDLDAAWQAGAGRGEEIGQHLLLRLLEARRATHPSDTIGPYRQLVEEQILDSRDKHHYRRAVALLRELRLAYLGVDDPTGFDDYLDQVRAAHRRRPTFLSTLDRTHW